MTQLRFLASLTIFFVGFMLLFSQAGDTPKTEPAYDPPVAKASDDVRPGVISMAHCWGGSPADKAATDAQVREVGSNTNRLVRNRGDNARYSGMARQSCIPVTLEPLTSAEAGAMA